MNDTLPGLPEPREGERGAAMITVMGVGLVLAMLMSLLVVTTVNGMKQARADANWNAALAAAYAGVDDYQSRLSADTSYYRFGNPASSFSATSTVTLPTETNKAFGVGTTGTWANVSGSTERAQFRYEVDNSKYATTGRIRVRATGRVGDATRTVTADLKQQGFIDYLYFTDYEAQDPSVAGTSSTSCFTDSTKTTLRYSWAGRTVGSTCNEISFGAADDLQGPVHSNDTIRACGSRFEGTVTTADSRSPYYSARNSSGNTCTEPTFELAGYPSYSGGVVGMPATNSELKKETRTDLVATEVPRPGCLYTGPTQFTFYANGTVNIKSPFTKKTRIGNANSTTGTSPAECGTISALQSSAGATITVPEYNVMFVQNVPSVTSDVNYWSSSTNPTDFTCTTSSSTSAGKPGWSFGTGSSKIAFPSSTEKPPTITTYGCRAGDVFVSGEFNGAATLAAENYVFVTGDITYVNDQEDILGLVGNNAVWVYNPLTSTGNALLAKNRTIEAAILSVAHTFQVQNYNKGGNRGTLTVLGAIAQKYRGTVATTSGSSIVTGYAKDYRYDDRFKFYAPPKFLNPVTTTYGVTSWVESKAVFAADGSAS